MNHVPLPSLTHVPGHSQHLRQLFQDSGTQVENHLHAIAPGHLSGHGLDHDPGVERRGADEIFREERRDAGQLHFRHVQPLYRRRASTLRRWLPGNHALHHRDHHYPIDDGSGSPVEQTGAGRRRARQTYPIWPLPDSHIVSWARDAHGFDLGTSGEAPEVHRHAGVGREPLVVSDSNCVDSDDRHTAADVVGGTNHGTRHRQWRFAGHYHRNCGGPAKRRSGGLRHVYSARRRRTPV